jgi:3-hydroxy-D-aspartate aldolase
MTQPVPAAIGDAIDAIDTPALLLDLDAFEANLARMAETARSLGVALRPHAKSHKCAEIARRQMAAGAVGVCVQKVSEAEALAAAGIGNILICNELVTRRKVAALIRAGRQARVIACVDHLDNVALIAQMAAEAGVVIPLMIEVDVGQGRCGIAPGAGVVALARHIEAEPALEFVGLHAYQGSAQHVRDVGERRDKAAAAVRQADLARSWLSEAGIACPVISGAGTGTFEVEGASGVYNEIQPGSYVFMDADYNRNAWAERPFRQSLFVLAGVVSATAAERAGTGNPADLAVLPADARGPGRAIVDAGLKAMAFDSGLPDIPALPGQDPTGLAYGRPSDEHGTISVADGVPVPRIGSTLRLVPGHCDPTVNLHDWIVVVRGDRVVDLWAVTARGCLA